MERQWKEFEHGPVVNHSERIHVTINRRGTVYLNRRAFEAMGEPECVILLYDSRRSTIGISRAPASRRNAFRLKHKDLQGSGGRIVYASNFCRFNHIRPQETLAFTAAEVDKEGVLILDLNEVAPARSF